MMQTVHQGARRRGISGGSVISICVSGGRGAVIGWHFRVSGPDHEDAYVRADAIYVLACMHAMEVEHVLLL